MPFTFSHPAIILPLRTSRYVSVSALVIGSMSPDFEYILKMQLHATISHTFQGAFLLDLPICIGLYLAFHLWIKRPLLANSPALVRSRLGELYAINAFQEIAKRLHILLLSFLIGIFSHFLWDSFTHDNTLMVNTLPFLSMTMDLGFITLPVFRVLQHISTLLGAWAIYFALLRQKPEAVPLPAQAKLYWGISAFFFLLLIAIRSLWGYTHFGHGVAAVLGAFVYALLLSGLFFTYFRRGF